MTTYYIEGKIRQRITTLNARKKLEYWKDWIRKRKTKFWKSDVDEKPEIVNGKVKERKRSGMRTRYEKNMLT